MARKRIRNHSTGGQIVNKSSIGTFKAPVYLSTESCVDEVHHGPPYKSGGLLLVDKTSRFLFPSEHVTRKHPFYWYDGRFWVTPGTTARPTPFNLSGWGAKGFSRGLPVHDELNLGQFLAELKDVPQMLRSTYNFFSQFSSHAFSGKSLKFWSEAHLNAQFGWKPFLNDLWGLLNLQQRLMARLAWLKAHNGQNIKRKFTLTQYSNREVVASTDVVASMSPALVTFVYPGYLQPRYMGHTETIKTTNYRIWFAGCFTFHVPIGDPLHGYDPLLKTKLLGLMPDLNLVYKVTPWSWLLDWFTSVGAVITNASLMAKYGQVARYAYVMASTEVEVVTNAFQYVYSGQTGGDVTLVRARSALKYAIRQREVANPYGFGTTWDSLNPWQMSILAALGITRGNGFR